MKKSVFFLTLLLCLSLILPGAQAEDTYVPGERMRSLVSSALEAGQLVGGEAHFSLTLPDSRNTRAVATAGRSPPNRRPTHSAADAAR